MFLFGGERKTVHSFVKSTLTVFGHESLPTFDHIGAVYLQAEEPGYPYPRMQHRY